MSDVPKRPLRPLSGLLLPLLIRTHCPVGLQQVLGNNMRPHQRFDELADLLAPDHAVESLVDLFIYGNRQLLVNRMLGSRAISRNNT